ncbi:MAG TPA: PEGA domain-containing protein, partial [Polyangiales bacterium]
VIQKLVDSGINCPSGVQNCDAKDVLNALDLGAVVLVAIWWSRTPADITIEITSADAVGTAKGKLDADVNERVPGLVAGALQDLKNGKAVQLQINTLPVGAEVRLDGELLGTSPVKGRAVPGAHEIVASYPDYVTTSQHLELPRGADGPVPVHIALERATSSSARVTTAPLAQREATPSWDYALGGTLGGVGALLVVTPVLTAVRSGDCFDGPNNVACQRVHFGARAGLQLVGGVLALAGATWLIVKTPIRASLSTDGDSAYAQLKASF